MPLNFTRQTNEAKTFSLGQVALAGGPICICILLKMATDETGVTRVALWVGTATGATRYHFSVGDTGSNQLTARFGNSIFKAPTITVPVSDGWCLIGLTKAAGTSTPRWFKFVYSTDTLTAENHGATIADWTTPTGNAYIGNSQPGTDGFKGDIHLVAVLPIVPSDAQFQAMAYSLWSLWAPAQPKAVWLLDQDVTTQKVPDLSGGGANESATSGMTISTSEPPVWTPHGEMWVERHSVPATQSLPPSEPDRRVRRNSLLVR